VDGHDPHVGRTGSVGGVLLSVDPRGPAGRAGLQPGDVVVAANGRRLRDVIDWRWESDEASVEIEFERAAQGRRERQSALLARGPGEAWGMDFEYLVFDGIRTCVNRCVFCFLDQLPAGLRSSLYLRDDDYRLSFLKGNFITLTNLDDADVTRIAEQRLSPLYVSLHAVDPGVRARLLCASEDRALQCFDELVAAGIDLHVQIVLVPEVNDGAELERTLCWLAQRETVRSVGVVPLGYTAHQKRFSRSYGDPYQAAEVLDHLDTWREVQPRGGGGGRWAHAADEFYLTARREIPSATEYWGFPQYENGIGLVRTFIHELLDGIEGRWSYESRPSDTVVLTGSLFAPVLRRLIEESLGTREVEVVGVENTFLGGNVSVTGLLTGTDLLKAMTVGFPEKRFLIPDIVFNDDGLTLDGMTAAHLSKGTGHRVEVVPATATGLLFGIL